MHVAIMTRQIGHYHDARYRAAAQAFGKVTVVSVANEGGFAEFLARDLGGYRVERVFENSSAYETARASGGVRRAVQAKLDSIQPTVVAVAGWASTESFAAIEWAGQNRCGLVMMSESQDFDARRFAAREFLKSRVVGACHAALVGGPSHRDYIVKLGMRPERVFLGYNAVGNTHFAAGAIAARRDAAGQRALHALPDRYLLASARFIEKKNLPALVTAYAKAQADVEAAPDLVILGDGPMRASIMDAITRHGLQKRVHLLGFRGYDVLPTYYGLAQGFAHVSRVEQWGLVINEAMASGIPVVVSHTCGASQAMVCDGVNGFVVDPEDIAGMAKALVRLFRLTPAERSRIGEAASATVSEWGPERFGAGLKAASEAARALAHDSRMAVWDTVLLRWLERRTIEQVN